jgi:hypothetical protein
MAIGAKVRHLGSTVKHKYCHLPSLPSAGVTSNHEIQRSVSRMYYEDVMRLMDPDMYDQKRRNENG